MAWRRMTFKYNSGEQIQMEMTTPGLFKSGRSKPVDSPLTQIDISEESTFLLHAIATYIRTKAIRPRDLSSLALSLSLYLFAPSAKRLETRAGTTMKLSLAASAAAAAAALFVAAPAAARLPPPSEGARPRRSVRCLGASRPRPRVATSLRPSDLALEPRREVSLLGEHAPNRSHVVASSSCFLSTAVAAPWHRTCRDVGAFGAIATAHSSGRHRERAIER
jgi:hypothetical protein